MCIPSPVHIKHHFTVPKMCFHPLHPPWFMVGVRFIVFYPVPILSHHIHNLKIIYHDLSQYIPLLYFRSTSISRLFSQCVPIVHILINT